VCLVTALMTVVASRSASQSAGAVSQSNKCAGMTQARRHKCRS
jgi:hypothetical protein